MEVRESTSQSVQVCAPAGEPADPELVSDRMLAFADQHRRALFAGLVVLYFLGFNGQWRLEPDSALYLTVGRNLAEGAGYTYQGMQHRLAFPGLPLLFAGIFKLFHTQSLVPALVMMPLLGFVTLALTYRLFLLHAERPTAVMVTFGLGVTRLFYRYCFELLSDLPFLMGVMAFLAGFEAVFGQPRDARAHRDPRWYDWALLVCGLALAVAMRPAMWALLVAVAVVLAVSFSRGLLRRASARAVLPASASQASQSVGAELRWGHLLVCLLIAAAAVTFYLLDPRHAGGKTMGGYEDALFEMKLAHLGDMLRAASSSLFRIFPYASSQALFGCPLGPGLNEVVGIVFLLLAGWLLRHRLLWGLWVFLTIIMMLVVIKPLDRYYLAVIPLLVFAWWKSLVWVNHRFKTPRANMAFLALFALGGTTNLARIGELVVEQHRSPFLAHYQEGHFASMNKVAALLRANTAPGDWVLCGPKLGRTISFLTRRYAVGLAEQLPVDPAIQPVYLLEPVKESVHDWLKARGYVAGPALGAVKEATDVEPWVLYKITAPIVPAKLP